MIDDFFNNEPVDLPIAKPEEIAAAIRRRRERQLHPKPKRPEPDHSDRSWAVKYDLAYDGGGSAWTQYYHTQLGARISAWLHCHIRSWGGSAILIDNRKEQYYG